MNHLCSGIFGSGDTDCSHSTHPHRRKHLDCCAGNRRYRDRIACPIHWICLESVTSMSVLEALCIDRTGRWSYTVSGSMSKRACECMAVAWSSFSELWWSVAVWSWYIEVGRIGRSLWCFGTHTAPRNCVDWEYIRHRHRNAQSRRSRCSQYHSFGAEYKCTIQSCYRNAVFPNNRDCLSGIRSRLQKWK